MLEFLVNQHLTFVVEEYLTLKVNQEYYLMQSLYKEAEKRYPKK